MKCKWEIPAEIKSSLKTVAEFRSRFGMAKTLPYAGFRLLNRFFHFGCLHIIALDRENLKPLDPAKAHRLSTKVATLEDIKEMEKQGCWHFPPKIFEYFDRGATCLLSYIDDELAGYTWVLGDERPAIIEDLRLIAPDGYLYNFAGFTLPEYRGYGLQSFRHHELLNHPRWRTRKGLIGYVIHTNRISKRGQDKSGYKRIGKAYVIGRPPNVYALIGKNLLSMGFKRINRSSLAKMKQRYL